MLGSHLRSANFNTFFFKKKRKKDPEICSDRKFAASKFPFNSFLWCKRKMFLGKFSVLSNRFFFHFSAKF